ncbi:cupin domain-containing protein [Actinoplanes sp. NPDC049596]|uniref:cupin domain-containing protein n=1 Tax=unclassified Actinoplanes TaxID=2626549 RepID=UPI0034122CF0
MKIQDLLQPGGRDVPAYGSAGLTAEALLRAEGVAVTVLRVAAGGRIGRHPAMGDQMLLVVAGRGRVRSGDDPWQPVGPGQVVRWPDGEDHTTEADEDLVCFVVETG